MMASVVCLCCLRVLALQAVDNSEPASAVEQIEVKQLLRQLDAESFTEREAASQGLMKIGSAAREPLYEAKINASAEVRLRIVDLIRHLDCVPWEAACEAFAKRPDDQLDVEEGMWLIARILNPQLSREELSVPLDRLAGRVRRQLGGKVAPSESDPELVVAAVRKVLFEDDGYNGNRDDYQNPNNNSLEKVLKTRKGLPIVLSHLVVAVGRRLEVPLAGVPAPSRYLVRYDGQKAPPGFPQTDLLMDPFGGGRLLSAEDQVSLFPGVDPEAFRQRDTSREALIRMLNNLESHLFQQEEHEQAYRAVSLRVLLAEFAGKAGRAAPDGPKK
jgi:regulator of sirC expression with transglutaminase-like and TPR domain